MLREPKEKFQKSQHRNAFEQIVTSPAFEEATLAALLQFQSELPPPIDPAKGWDQASQLQGARRFLEILCALHKPDEKPKARVTKELNEEAGV